MADADKVGSRIQDNRATDQQRRRRGKTPGLLAYGLCFTGITLIMLSVLGAEVIHWPVWITAFVRDVGLLLSAVMAGTILHEKFLRDEMLHDALEGIDEKLKSTVPKLEEIDSRLDLKVPTVEQIASHTASKVHELFCEHPPGMTGIRLLADVRRSFAAYYGWTTEKSRQELFFAGRSVLHRIDADLKSRGSKSAEDVLLRRLLEGSKINILFLDPRTNILERLAKEEGQMR